MFYTIDRNNNTVFYVILSVFVAINTDTNAVAYSPGVTCVDGVGRGNVCVHIYILWLSIYGRGMVCSVMWVSVCDVAQSL